MHLQLIWQFKLIPLKVINQIQIQIVTNKSSGMINQSPIDYFKLFKIFDLKKLDKSGQVKIIQDKILFKKILSVEGVVSTDSSITFNTLNHVNVSFREQYLYMLSYCESGKTFCFQLQYYLNSKQYKIVFNSTYKQEFKRKNDNTFNIKLRIPSNKWTVVCIDLYSIINWDQSYKNDKDVRLSFRISSIEVRAHSKIKGIYQSDNLYSPHNLPKQMQFNPDKTDNFYDKFDYVLIGLNLKQQIKHQIQQQKQTYRNTSKFEQINSKVCDNQNQDQRVKSKSQAKLAKHKQSASKQKNTKQNKITSASQDKILHSKSKGKSLKTKQTKTKYQFQQQKDDVQDQFQVIQKQAPKPIPSIIIKLQSVQGLSCFQNKVLSVGSLLVRPVMLQTHKYISKLCKGRLGKVLVAYEDGCLCLWDTIRKQSIFYFKSQFELIKVLEMDNDMNIVIVGLDKLKREVIQIISEQNIIFRQISNFPINNLKLICPESFQFGFISYGLQNIRIWTINPQNQIINGFSIYLGQTARGVNYRDCQIISSTNSKYAFVCDSSGYITKVNIDQQKMERIIKVQDIGIDHIRLIYLQDVQKILICNEKGVIKILNCQNLQSQMEIPLDYRIKKMYVSDQKSSQSCLMMETYNKTLCELNLNTFNFQFLVRSHSQEITHILNLMQQSNKFTNVKVVSAGKDSTLRIWKNCQISSNQYCLKEQYQFLINGQNIVQLSISNNSKEGSFVYVLTDCFKIRKINVSCYQIIKEITINQKNLNQTILSFAANQKGKFLILSTSHKTYLLDNNLQILHIYSYQAQNSNGKKNKNVVQNIAGFNKRTKCFYFYNPEQLELLFYSFKNLELPIFKIKLYQKVLCSQWVDDTFHLLTINQYQMYIRQTLKQVLPISQGQYNNLNALTMQYPVLCKSYSNSISVQILNGNLQQNIKMPEQINKISIVRQIIKNQTQQQGAIICSGIKSYSLYYLRYKLINMNLTVSDVSQLKQTFNEDAYNQFYKQKGQYVDNQPILDISFSQTASRNTMVFRQDLNQEHKKSRNNDYSKYNKKETFESQPKQLKKLYEDQEKMFDQCKHAILGDYFENQLHDQHTQANNYQQQNSSQEENSHEMLKLKTFYGFQTNQSLFQSHNAKVKKQLQTKVGKFYWSKQFQKMVLLTNNYKSILIHKFAENISHKLINFRSKPSSICWTKSDISIKKHSNREVGYYVVCLNSIMKLYNFESMTYIKPIENQMLVKNQHIIFKCALSCCNSYIVTLSYSLPQYLENKKWPLIYIFLIQIASGKTITSSYLQSNQHFSYYNLYISPFSSSLQFILTSSYNLYFYRISSIFTLQMIQLQTMQKVCKQKIQVITCAEYLTIEDDVYIFLGSQNGSIAVVDNRTASLILVCVQICKQAIYSIQSIPSSSISNQENAYDKLLLFTKSNLIKTLKLKDGLKTLVEILNKNQIQLSQIIANNNQIQRTILLDGQIQSISGLNGSQQFAITKNGSLWLIDYQDYCTIKILAIHSETITQAQIITNNKQSDIGIKNSLLTSSTDGFLKLTNLTRLEQSLQIYKPRKQAKCFNVNQNYTLCAFNQEIYFYDSITQAIDAKNIEYLGSLKLQSEIIDIVHIPYSDNYYVLSEKQIFIIFVQRKDKINSNSKISQKKNCQYFTQNSLTKFSINIQMRLITQVNGAYKIQLNTYKPYDQFSLLCRGGKINTWLRKCLKRTSNPLQQLCQVHKLEYYLVDAYHRSDCLNPSLSFISETEYACCIGERSLIQVRNYNEHTIISELNFNCEKITAMLYYQHRKNEHSNNILNQKNKLQNTIFIGDQYGYIYICDRNGFVIQKKKVFEGPICRINISESHKSIILNLVSQKYCALVRLKCD